MYKAVRLLGMTMLILIATLLLGWLGARHLIIVQAEARAQAVIREALQQTPDITGDTKIISIAARIFNIFHHQDPATIPLLRVRKYITNHRLPEFIRLPDGVIETLMGKGYCDNAARMLSFVLKQENIHSVQWNMVSMNGGHSALLVTTPDNRNNVLVDPFYGYVTVDDQKRLIQPEQAKEQLKRGKTFDDVFLPLGEMSNPAFYQDFEKMSMAAAGNDLIMSSTVPALQGAPLILGQIDGDDLDVKNAGAQKGITPYWHYVGHKYNREWVRILNVTEPVQIVMTLIAPAEDGIMTATPAPAVRKNQLIWDLKPGEKLTFTDTLAKLSLKRLNSYIGVDQIAFYPAP